ncbi:MAG: YggS family pyridoxal phosphate-dependent enzyme [Candidatus Dadabacteria bacterium]
MLVNRTFYLDIQKEFNEKQVVLVAVSKTKPIEAIKELYDLGHRDFGENYVQELEEKQQQLPADIRWHYIGHLQTNKVRYITPFVHLVQSVDSIKLLKEINKQAQKSDRIVDVLLQVHIAQEETKFGFDETEIKELFGGTELNELKHVRLRGLMGMGSLTEDMDQVRKEFQVLKQIFDSARVKLNSNEFNTLSMGMSSDYKVAIEEGSNMVRIGSLLFGARS